MTATYRPRRALVEETRDDRARKYDRLVSLLEDHIDRLEGEQRQYGPQNLRGQNCAQFAGDLRRFLKEVER